KRVWPSASYRTWKRESKASVSATPSAFLITRESPSLGFLSKRNPHVHIPTLDGRGLRSGFLLGGFRPRTSQNHRGTTRDGIREPPVCGVKCDTSPSVSEPCEPRQLQSELNVLPIPSPAKLPGYQDLL